MLKAIQVACAVAGLLCLPVAAQSSPPNSSEAIGQVLSTGAGVRGSVVLSSNGAELLPGSTVDAGASLAVIKLARGGVVNVCAGSSMTLNAAPGNSSGLMMSLSTGSLETDYNLAATADSIVTPDFRVLLAGPARFHLAITADAQGNTCIRGLAGNSGSVLVSELLGNATYQVKSTGAVFFPAGHIGEAAALARPCGCAEAQPAAQQTKLANAKPPEPPPQPAPAQASAPPPAPAQPAETKPKPGEQVAVDAPFVFTAVAAPPDATQLPIVQARAMPAPVVPEVLPPEEEPPPEPATTSAPPAPPVKTSPSSKPGFFRKLRGFFAGIFGKKR